MERDIGSPKKSWILESLDRKDCAIFILVTIAGLTGYIAYRAMYQISRQADVIQALGNSSDSLIEDSRQFKESSLDALRELEEIDTFVEDATLVATRSQSEHRISKMVL